MPDFFDARRPHDGLTYDAYRAYWQAQRDAPLDTEHLSPDELRSARKTKHYLQYNWDRQAATHDAYAPSDALRDAMAALDEPQLWMVLTEPWCGDSAFSLPVLAEAAGLSAHVTLRILLRDDHLGIMDQYLTGGSRSVPKLVAFADAPGTPADGAERFTWGPRPEAAQALFDELRDEGVPKPQIVQRLVDWYADGGFMEVDRELANAVHPGVAA